MRTTGATLYSLILVAAHRPENFGAGFEDIWPALAAIGARDDVKIVFLVHPNSNVQEPVLVMREVTERPEAVAAGTVRLVGTEAARLVDILHFSMSIDILSIEIPLDMLCVICHGPESR